MTRRFLLLLLTSTVFASAAICSPSEPDFSGTWKQSNERCVPKRTGTAVRHIDQRGSDLVVETNVVRSSGPPRHAVQRYTTDGVTSVSTGTDGDEFHTSVTRNGDSLIFAMEEHERGRVIHSKEKWTLIENGSALKIDRENLGADDDGPQKQTLVYLLQSPSSNGQSLPPQF